MSNPISILVTRVRPGFDDLPLPQPATPFSSGCDLRAAVELPVKMKQHERILVPTGIAIAIPPGYEGQVRPRSGLAIRHGITMLNTPGTIDADYRGEIRLIVINLGQDPYTIQRGERISLIQFGSRVEVYLPRRAKIKVNLGDKVIGGETVIAAFD